MLLRIDPRTSSLTALCFTHCSNLSFCLLLLICSYLSSVMFSNFRFVPRQLNCLFTIILRASSVFLNAFSCISVTWKLICLLRYYSFIEHVCSPKFTLFTAFLVCTLLDTFLLLILNWLIMNRFEWLIWITVTIKGGKKLFVYFCRESIPEPHFWQPYALPILLICLFACYFSFAHICLLLCSQTFFLFLDNFFIFLNSLFVL